MRYDVKKFLFVGADVDKEKFFRKAQDAGIIHFIDPKQSKMPEVPALIQNYNRAIKILRGLPPTEQEETDECELADGLVQKIISLKEKLENLEEEERVANLEKSRVEAFGAFSTKELAQIERETNRKVQFFCAKQGFAEKNPLPEEMIYIASEHGLDYFCAINKEPQQYPKMVELNIDKSYSELKERLKEISNEHQEIFQKLKKYAKYNQFLHHALLKKLNNYHLENAINSVQFPLDEKLFVVEGWVPVHQEAVMHNIVHGMNVFVEPIALDKNDVEPTYLENEGAGKIGEDLIQIYDTPSNTDKDPSLWVLVFFALFFSMIVGDAGYGLVLLLIALYIRYKHQGLKGFKKRFLNLVTILSFCVIAWGVLMSSFFGLQPAPDSPIRKFSLIQWLVEKKTDYIIKHKDETYEGLLKKFPDLRGVTNPVQFIMRAKEVKQGKETYVVMSKFSDHIMMELALLVGVIHVILSMLRNVRRNPTYIGWILFLIGCYLYMPNYLGAISIINFVLGVNPVEAAGDGMILMICGVVIAFVIALFKHKWMGLLEPSSVIQIFGDILSYLRLYALGLSGAMFSATLYELAGLVNFVIGAMIILLGHIVNIGLGIMGGVIHGLRLNFLEWYHYSFEGGGKKFNPLRKLEID